MSDIRSLDISIQDCNSINKPEKLIGQQQKLENNQINGYTFRQCINYLNNQGQYQKKLLFLMAAYWICASFFLVLPFYLFRKPLFIGCKNEFDQFCIDKICQNHPFDIKDQIIKQVTFTYKFQLFCKFETLRIIYKVCPQSLSWIGLIIYGIMADKKGRKVALKIAWRFYTIGVILFALTQTQFLITFGYIIASINCFPALIIIVMLLFQQSGSKMHIKTLIALLVCLFIGPFLSSFFIVNLINQIGIRLTLIIFCGIPAFILSILINQIQQSAIFVYKENKLKAFNIINHIALSNGQKLLKIDFNNSSWRQYKNYNINIFQALNNPQIMSGIINGFIMMLGSCFNKISAQVLIDFSTKSQLRSILMNSSSAIGDLTLIILMFYIIKTTRLLSLFVLVIYICRIILYYSISNNNEANSIIMTIISLLIRYLSEINYGIILMWVIQHFPTVCRGQCIGLVLCGGSLACILVYCGSKFPLALNIMGIILSLCMLLTRFQPNISKDNKMVDTITRGYYDQYDKFVVIQS